MWGFENMESTAAEERRSMSLIIGERINHAFGDRKIIEEASFRIADADRIGLVGPNGEGKTTLLRIIAAELEATTGQVHRRRDLSVGYLSQTPPDLGDATIQQAMLDVFGDLRRREEELHDLAVRMEEAGDTDQLAQRYGALQTEFEMLGGYDYHMRIEQVLTGLGFDRAMWERPLASLSGGQRTRVYLGTLLLSDPDVLLLDEPTNHLDVDSVEWLEQWLRSFAGALVLVSHDRYLLDNVTTRTWEIAARVLAAYRGNYSKYRKLRDERLAELAKRYEAQQEYIAKTRDFVARHMAGQRSKEAQGRQKRLERFMRDEAIAQPVQSKTMHLRLSAQARAGDMVLRASDLSAGYDATAPLLKDLDLEIGRGDRVALVGANGTGKTTLLRTLMGELAALSGSVRLGANVKVGYLSQDHSELDPARSALDAVMEAGRGLKLEEARTLLGGLLLSGDEVFKPTGELSGGQRMRVALARLVVRDANVLMLDEPTNHLDIPSTEVVQEVLQRFGGTAVMVSHDRYLVQAAATHIWAIDGSSIRVILGGWEDYLAWRKGSAEGDVSPADSVRSADNAGEDRPGDTDIPRRDARRQARRRSNEMQTLRRRHGDIEEQIDALEKELADLNEAIGVAGRAGDTARVAQLGERYQSRDTQLAQLWRQWEEVGEQIK